MYDITKEKTFENVVKWMEELKYNADPDIVIMLVGNKLDLVESNPQMRKVKAEEAGKFADTNGLLFYEASAVAPSNVDSLFENLLQGLLQVEFLLA